VCNYKTKVLWLTSLLGATPCGCQGLIIFPLCGHTKSGLLSRNSTKTALTKLGHELPGRKTKRVSGMFYASLFL
jgi:hypothetical protein